MKQGKEESKKARKEKRNSWELERNRECVNNNVIIIEPITKLVKALVQDSMVELRLNGGRTSFNKILFLKFYIIYYAI